MDHDPLSTTFAALADPTRRAILERLADGDATVGELAEPFAMTLPAISKHLSVLERAGLVAKDRDGQRRQLPDHRHPTEERDVVARGVPPPLGGQPRQPRRLPQPPPGGRTPQPRIRGPHATHPHRNHQEKQS